MTKEDFRIVYMGTPDFAVESLRRLVDGGYQVVGVVTMPDKPMGRHGSVLQSSPVKKYALEHGLKVMQPVKLKDEAFLEELAALDAHLQIVVAFRMLPEVVWNMPKLGTFNLHASLLPQYRGAAPINWAVINGEKETGVTTFFLQHEIDTGEIIQQVRIPISDNDNAGTVHDRLMTLGGDLVVNTVDAIINGTVKTVPQEICMRHDTLLKPAPKIFRDTCRIDWNHKNLQQLHDFVRGLSPYPAAWTIFEDGLGKKMEVKIFETRTERAAHHLPIGSLLTDGKSSLKVAVDGGFLHVLTLQLAGKKQMDIRDFLRGRTVGEKASFC